MKAADIVTLVGVILIFTSIILFGGYYLFTETNMCVSNPMLYKFGDQYELVEDKINSSNNAKMCIFRDDNNLIPELCVDIK